MKGKIKKIGAALLSATLLLSSFTACKGGSTSDIKFWVYGDEEELEVYELMTNKFNSTYGKEHGYHVDISVKPPANYESLIQTVSTSKTGPDVFIVIDDYFKKWIGMGFLGDLQEEFDAVQDIDISNLYPSTVNRLRFDAATGTSPESAPLYGMPLDAKPSALYYNETQFKKAGIVVISVDEENMDDFNKGDVPDRRGITLNQYKTMYPQLNNLEGAIPAKGYFRSYPENVYVLGDNWVKPANDEILIFNNRIAMNWDEIEDLSMLFSKSYNPSATADFGTEYGYFTEWWFNYGWSVGGDCLQDLTGNGDWNFSLLDQSANYMVMQDGYVGEYTGKVYKAGETLEHNDKYDVPKGELMVADNAGGYTYDGQQIGIRASVAEKATEAAGYALRELPSTREAFTRYLRLGSKRDVMIEGIGGLDISPNPMTFSTVSRQRYFYSGKMAMLVEYSSYMNIFSEQMTHAGFEWDIAPLAVYKEYVEPENPYNGDYIVKGGESGQSSSKSLVTREKAANKQGAAAFMKWMAAHPDGQAIRVSEGHFPNDPAFINDMKFKAYAPKNAQQFSKALAYQGPGDWWYLADYEWINIWAVPLNSYVRNGSDAKRNGKVVTYDMWLSEVVVPTNERLKIY